MVEEDGVFGSLGDVRGQGGSSLLVENEVDVIGVPGNEVGENGVGGHEVGRMFLRMLGRKGKGFIG